MDTVLSPYLITPLAAWLVAQLLKYSLLSAKRQSFKDFRLLYKSGDMPSSHAAVVISLLAVVAVLDGVGSGLFGVAVVVAAIVLYDAVNVRRAVGEHGATLRALLARENSHDKFYSAKGHTVTEVVAGSLIGFVVAIIMLQLL